MAVDNFGVKHVSKKHTMHLKVIIEENYTVTSEWDGKRYIVITFEWDYKQRQVHLSMPNYIVKSLK